MSLIERYLELKKRIEQTEQDANKALGVLESQMKELKTSFNCENPKEALILLEQCKQSIAELEQQMNKQLDVCDSKWRDKLENTT